MKIDQAEVVNDSGRSYLNIPEVLFYSVYKSRKRLLSVHDGARFFFFFLLFCFFGSRGKKITPDDKGI